MEEESEGNQSEEEVENRREISVIIIEDSENLELNENENEEEMYDDEIRRLEAEFDALEEEEGQEEEGNNESEEDSSENSSSAGGSSEEAMMQESGESSRENNSTYSPQSPLDFTSDTNSSNSSLEYAPREGADLNRGRNLSFTFTSPAINGSTRGQGGRPISLGIQGRGNTNVRVQNARPNSPT